MNVLVVTGEKSAENYASILVDTLSSLDNSLKFYSICSNILDKKTEKIADYREISIIGAKEALGVIGKALALLRKIKNFIKANNINIIILMDFPEFNMRIAKFSKKLGIKIVYYISPQVWAWREYRIKSLFKYSDLVIPILPFEKTFFNVKGVNKNKLAYCGHPLVDLLHSKLESPKTKREKIILLMPGSRKTEIEHNYEVMFKSAKMIKEVLQDFRFVWAIPDNIEIEFAKNLLKGFEFITIEKDSHKLMKSAYFGILKSGTTTLEAAMFQLPMTVVYKVSKTNYSIGRILIRNIKYISLPNLISGEEIIKEFVGTDIESRDIANECLRICTNLEIYRKIQERLKGVSCVLGNYPVTQKIAERILSIV